ncbi:MAG TPA: Hsp20/alpha crystallin family protein [Candidatus Binatia bacterium]|nr:Hsp20/alpha crystallin family protein [Candidatus Binatia bacterium]
MNETRELARSAETAPEARPRTPRVVETPRVDAREGAESFLVVADLPGVGPEDLEVVVDRNVLTIVGRSRREAPEGYRLLYGSAPATEYRRVFKLGDAIDRDAIEATVKHGTLFLTLPKARAARPRKIAVAS